MKSFLRFRLPAPALLAAGVVALIAAACESGPSSPSSPSRRARAGGPTVAIKVVTVPSNIKIYSDAIPAGDSPATVNVEVNDDGSLAYNVDITADYSAQGTNRMLGAGMVGTNEPVVVKLKTGEIPPETIQFDVRAGIKRGQSLVKNGPGVEATAPPRNGPFDGIPSSTGTAGNALPTSPMAPASLGGRGGF